MQESAATLLSESPSMGPPTVASSAAISAASLAANSADSSAANSVGFPDHVATYPFDMLNYIYSEKLLDLYSNLSIALQLLLTLPVTVASGERSFSALKLIKTYMRSTMSQERLTGLAVTSIECDVRRSLDMEDIVVAFAEAKARKQQM